VPKHRALLQVVELAEPVRDEGVARVLAAEDGGDLEARGHVRRHVLHRVHRQLGAPIEHRAFQLLDKQALAADGVEPLVEELVATR
jgi:hypothetical protein